MRHVAVAVSLLRHHEIAPAIEARLDCRIRRKVEVPVGLGIIAGAIGIRRIDRNETSVVHIADPTRAGLGRAAEKHQREQNHQASNLHPHRNGPRYPAAILPQSGSGVSYELLAGCFDFGCGFREPPSVSADRDHVPAFRHARLGIVRVVGENQSHHRHLAAFAENESHGLFDFRRPDVEPPGQRHR